MNFACLPCKANIPEGREGWVLTRCPVCGKECWDTPAYRDALRLMPDVVGICTRCAIGKAGEMQRRSSTPD